MDHKELKNLLLILLVTASAVAGVSSIAPALPKIAEHFSIHPEDTGFILLSFTLPGIFFSAMWGILSDRIGRKRILLTSLMLFSVGGILSVLDLGFTFLLAMRFIQGIGASALFSLNVIVIGDLFDGEKRAIAMGYNAAVISGALALFPFLGGILSEIKWNLPFLLPSFSLAVFFLVAKYFDAQAAVNDETFPIYLSEIVRSLKNKHIIGILIGTLLYFMVQYGAFINYFSFLAKQAFEYSSSMSGFMMAVSSVIAAIVSYYIRKFEKILSYKNLYIFSFIACAASYVFMAFALTPFMLFIGILLFGMGQGLNMPLTPLLISVYVPEEQRGILMSINCTALSLGQTTGPLFFGILYKQLGLTEVFVVGGAIALFAMLLVVVSFNAKNTT